MSRPSHSFRRRKRLRRRRHVLLRRCAMWLGVLWAAPLSLAGLLLTLLIVGSGGSLRALQRPLPVLLVTGIVADRLLHWHPLGPMSAIAIGHVIIVRRAALTTRLLSHELEHVHQAARWGPLFPLAYLIASAWAVLGGGDAYWHNRFEVAARAAEIENRR